MYSLIHAQRVLATCTAAIARACSAQDEALLAIDGAPAHAADAFRYPSVSPAPLAKVLLDLLVLNPDASILLAAEYRPPPATAAAEGLDHVQTFFEIMRVVCAVTRVEAPREWQCDEISLWVMQLQR